jgi:predicted nucleic acid-binding Zn ribbon protein
LRDRIESVIGDRRCEWFLCVRAIHGRQDRRFCGEACKKKSARARKRLQAA